VAARRATRETSRAEERELWAARRAHARLGHINKEAMLELLRSRPLVARELGLTARGVEALGVCGACARGKQRRAAFRKAEVGRATEEHDVNAVWSWDLFEPSGVAGVGGEKYVLLGVEHATRLVVLYFERQKSEAERLLREHVAWADRQWPAQPVREMRSDGAGEFVSHALSEGMAAEGVEKLESAPYTPQANGKAERSGGVLGDVARTLLLESGLEESLWPKAWEAAVHLRNRLRVRAAGAEGGTVPSEEYFKREVSLADLRVFGAHCWVAIPAARRGGKMAPRAWAGRLVGYDRAPRTYQVYNEATGKIHVTRDVVFDEDEIVAAAWPARAEVSDGSGSATEGSAATEVERESDSGGGDLGLPGQGACMAREGGAAVAARGLTRQEADVIGRALAAHEGVAFDESTRLAWRAYVAAEGRERDEAAAAGDPANHREAMGRSAEEREEWSGAEEAEWLNCTGREVWEEVRRQAWMRVLPAVWAYKTKFDERGAKVKRKARLSAGGHRQVAGVDWHESYAPTGSMATTRIAASVAAARGMRSRQFDAVGAYLNSPLEEEIYMEVPAGFREGREGVVLRLRKALYGLVQGAAAWWKVLRAAMEEAGWMPTRADPALYVRVDGVRRGWAATHVDDIPAYASDEAMLEELKAVLASRFEITDEGAVTFVCGIEYRADGRGRVHASQVAYAQRVLARFGMADCKPVSSPMAVGARLKASDSPEAGSAEAREMAAVPYREAVGSLQYLAGGTRPDIMEAVGECARFLERPGRVHWAEVRRIMQFVKGSITRGIVLGRVREEGGLALEVFVDSDYADSDDRKSTTGYVALLGGAPVVWSSRRQVGKTKLSSCEAEIVALREACKEASYLRQLLPEFGVEVPPVVVHEDNQAALAWANSHGTAGRLKHIDVALHYARDCVEAKEIVLQYVASADQIADVLTKPLPVEDFRRLTDMMGMAERWEAKAQ
jgi:transposase InsO family protein